jgi:hypothetical protein
MGGTIAARDAKVWKIAVPVLLVAFPVAGCMSWAKASPDVSKMQSKLKTTASSPK